MLNIWKILKTLPCPTIHYAWSTSDIIPNKWYSDFYSNTSEALNLTFSKVIVISSVSLNHFSSSIIYCVWMFYSISKSCTFSSTMGMAEYKWAPICRTRVSFMRGYIIIITPGKPRHSPKYWAIYSVKKKKKLNLEICSLCQCCSLLLNRTHLVSPYALTRKMKRRTRQTVRGKKPEQGLCGWPLIFVTCLKAQKSLK